MFLFLLIFWIAKFQDLVWGKTLKGLREIRKMGNNFFPARLQFKSLTKQHVQLVEIGIFLKSLDLGSL